MAIRACLDTRFYTVHFAEKPSWTRKVVQAAHLSESLLVSSTISITELVYLVTPDMGLESMSLRVGSAKQAGIEFIPPSEEIADQAGRIILAAGNLPIADAIIAATALAHTGGRVYTDDPHFKKVPGIRVFWGRA